jgi:HK97 gp10 family phage protein
MMGIDVDTSEVEALAADLNAAGPKVAKLSSAEMTEVAKGVESAAKAAAPVDSGDLRASIHTIGGADWRRIQTGVRYATFVEFGTWKDAPQPYLWPQARRAQTELFDALAKLGDPFA